MTLIGGIAVARETEARLRRLAELVTEEARNQNLVSRDTIATMWERHVADSVQLLRFADTGPWLDLGSGAGFPGLVVAACGVEQVTLVEERRLRAAFLDRTARDLGVDVTIFAGKVQTVPTARANVISARAFAPLNRLLPMAYRFAGPTTTWILPKGKTAAEELATIADAWQGRFRLEPSVTDPDSAIIVATDVRPGSAQ
jgi:16S rRNA (guanine527-N7)-methyltransferase